MRSDILIDDFGRGAPAYHRLREATAEHLCDITVEMADDFQHRAALIPLDGALVIDGLTGAYRNERTPRHIARGGMDHYMVTLCLEGSLSFTAGRRSVAVRPGDLCLMDMAQANCTILAADEATKAAHNITLTLPRGALAPLLAAPDACSGSLIARDSAAGRLLAGHLRALSVNGAGAADATVITTGVLAGAVAKALGPAGSAQDTVDRAGHALLLAAIKRHITQHLQTDLIDVDRLCRKFAVSRATLYRLFEPEGGLWHYVREQRLSRAFRTIAAAAAEQPRMIDLALEFGFSSDSTFVRAFRRRFGLTPGEVRQLAGGSRRNAAINGHAIPDSVVRIKTLADQ